MAQQFTVESAVMIRVGCRCFGERCSCTTELRPYKVTATGTVRVTEDEVDVRVLEVCGLPSYVRFEHLERPEQAYVEADLWAAWKATQPPTQAERAEEAEKLAAELADRLTRQVRAALLFRDVSRAEQLLERARAALAA